MWIMPPFLLCKDNTFLSEMQIQIFRADVGRGAVMAKNCDKVGWGIWSERRWFAPHYNAPVGGHTCITAGERSEPAGGMTGE